MSRIRSVSPALVSEKRASQFTSLAKMISLCCSLEAAHASERWASSDADPALSKGNMSRKLQEAIMFSTCGSYEANRIKVAALPSIGEHPSRRTLSSSYVETYIDEWTLAGTPAMWNCRRWRKR